MHKRYSAIALCCAAALAGCGSSANSSSNSKGIGPSNIPVFRAGLAQLCQTGNAAAKGASPAKALVVLNRYLPQFKALSVQSSTMEAQYQGFLANLQAEAAALRTNNLSAVRAAEQKNAVLAKQLGVPACAG